MNNMVTLVNGREPIMAYDNEYKGKRYFHIRKMWTDDAGELQPGKGLGVPYEQKAALLQALAKLK